MGAGRHRDGSLPNPPLASLGCELLSHEDFAAGFLLLDFAPMSTATGKFPGQLVGDGKMEEK